MKRLAKFDIKKILDNPSLNASIHECGYTSLMVGAGENFLAPYIIFLKASNLQLSVLSSVPLLLGSIAQLAGVWITEISGSRLKLIMQCVLAQALVWIPAALLYGALGSGSRTVWIVVVLYALYFITGSLGAPAWSSLIGDLAPPDTRGQFFGIRNERGTVVMCLTLLGAGGILQAFTEVDLRGLGFFVLFMGAFVARMFSLHYLSLHRDLPFHIDPKSRFSYLDFLKRSPRSNFARFVFFISAMSFSVMVAGPFFSIYMLNVLHFSYFVYTLTTVMMLATMFFTMRYWGWMTDKYGNRNILRLCSAGVTVCPFLWLISSSISGVLLIQAFSGLVWAGYNLAAGNFLFDAVTPQKRTRCVAYQSITNAVFIFLGSISGAWLVSVLPDWLPLDQGVWTPQSAYLRIFFLSGVLRMLVIYFMLPAFREVRDVKSMRQSDLALQFIQILPYVGTTVDYFMKRWKGNFSGK